MTTKLGGELRLLHASVAVILSCGSVACGSEAPTEPVDAAVPATDDQEQAEASVLYRHPVVGLHERFEPGKLPVFDAKNSPTGRRYAMGWETTTTARGEIERNSGIYEWEREALPISERVGRATPSPYAVVPPELEAVAAAQPLREAVFNVRLRRPGIPPMAHRLQEEAARGAIHTRGDRAAARQRFIEARRLEVFAAQEPVMALVEKLGGKVLERCGAAYCLTISLPAGKVEALVDQAPNIVRVDEANRDVEDAVDGQNTAAAMQINQFYPTWQGWNVHPTGLDVGQFEPALPDIAHVGFNVNSTSWSRILIRYDCSSGTCSSTNLTTAGTSNHATAVAGLMIGSLMNAQDSRFTAQADRERRSGYGRDGQLVSYAGNYTAALNHLLDTINGPPEIFNMSASRLDSSNNPTDTLCRGQDADNQLANDVYEDGIAFIKSAGNLGNASATDCRIGSPGSAIGVFAVGDHGDSVQYDDAAAGEDEIRTNGIASTSSRGGTANEGGGRSIVGVTGYGCRTRMFDTSNGYGYSTCGTSFSTPSVTGASLAFMDHYFDVEGDAIDDPGMLYVNLLMMADRQSESGRLTSGFDGLWGAGRLRMRRKDAEGIDGPGAWGNYAVCIDDGEVYYLNLRGGDPIPSDSETLNAVIWWYDNQHETGGGVDNIDLRVQTYDSASATWSTARSSLSTGDNKERVYVNGATIDNKPVRLRVSGVDVTNDVTGCGGNSMKVYLSYMYEDSDRDDAEGPGDEIAQQ